MKSILKKSAVLTILSIMLITLIIPVFAHPGSLDENGGHYNRKTGEYHYHAGTHTDGSNNSSSSSTTRYYYDFEKFEDYTTSNFNNSANNSTKEESTTNNNIQTAKDSVFYTIGDIIGYVFVGIVFIIVFSKPIIYFAGFIYYAFIAPIFECIRNFIKIIRENIGLKNKLYARKMTKYNIFPLKKQNKILSGLWFDVEREDTISELIHFDCLGLKDMLPDDVILLNTFDLRLKNTDNSKPFGRYTTYKRYLGSELHSRTNCDPLATKIKLSLTYSSIGDELLCKKCWKSTDMEDYPDLFMPDWYRQYKEVKDKMDKYHITASDIKQRKQEEIASMLKKSDFNIWEQEIHSKIEQVKRIKRSVDVIIISYDESTKQAVIKGSDANEYITTFSACSCTDFSLHNLPCKHMYKLAATHGGIDFSKYV